MEDSIFELSADDVGMLVNYLNSDFHLVDENKFDVLLSDLKACATDNEVG